ncbi:MAG: hypothetical protein SGI97_06555 [candidate division Zixibacteria bacterium]|nr:hypothetical protein [candidate division Zixibacteria bacterium]
MTSSALSAFGFFFLAVITRSVFFTITQFTADDAYITFRYAENLAAGQGFVYNVGERVLGTTTPLFTFLLSFFSLVGLPTPSSALVLSLIFSGLTAAFLYRFAQSLGFTRLAFLPPLVYSFWPRSLVAETSGMETALFTLLVTAAFYYQHKRLDMYAIGMATLATVTRPEGMGLLLLILFVNVWQHRERIRKYLRIAGGILIPWIIFATFYFGSPIPNSIRGKLALYSQFGQMPLWDTVVYLMGWHSIFGWVIFVFALIGARWLWHKQGYGRLEVVWLFGMIAFYSLSSSKVFFWYITPIYPVYILFISASCVQLADAMKLRERAFSYARIAGGAVLIAGLIWISLPTVRYYAAYQETLERVHKQIGLYLFTQGKAGDRVAAEDIGYMGYYSQLSILDRDGLISPEFHIYNRQARYLDAVLDHTPRWVVAARSSPTSAFIDSARFTDSYIWDTSFSDQKYEYVLFQRRE